MSLERLSALETRRAARAKGAGGGSLERLSVLETRRTERATGAGGG